MESRILRRLTQVRHKDLAEAAGFNPTQIHRIWTGDAGVRLADMGAFFEALGLDVVEREAGAATIGRQDLEALIRLAQWGLGSLAETAPRRTREGDESKEGGESA